LHIQLIFVQELNLIFEAPNYQFPNHLYHSIKLFLIQQINWYFYFCIISQTYLVKSQNTYFICFQIVTNVARNEKNFITFKNST